MVRSVITITVMPVITIPISDLTLQLRYKGRAPRGMGVGYPPGTEDIEYSMGVGYPTPILSTMGSMGVGYPPPGTQHDGYSIGVGYPTPILSTMGIVWG